MHQWQASLLSNMDSDGPPFTQGASVEYTMVTAPNTVPIGLSEGGACKLRIQTVGRSVVHVDRKVA
jgi:hypothetical protein